MPAGETGFDDVVFDLVSVQYHSLKAGHDYGQYVRDANNAGLNEVASFFERVMTQDAERAKRCHEYLGELASKGRAGDQLASLRPRHPSFCVGYVAGHDGTGTRGRDTRAPSP